MPPDDRVDGKGSILSSLADLVVYAPIGLTLDAQDLAPDLARRGRQHTAAARRIGEFAVKAGMRRLDDLVAALDPSPSRAPATGSFDAPPTATGEAIAEAVPTPRSSRADRHAGANEPTAVEDPHDGGRPQPGEEPPLGAPLELAIPDYDLLAASQVVKRLDALDADQLDAIRRHEEAGRGRRTILHKIARLQVG